jgi:CheY-like chemotaxis protein
MANRVVTVVQPVSKVLAGSVFAKLKVASIRFVIADDFASESEQRRSVSVGTGIMDNSDKHILVAEDNAALLSVIRFNLERAGFQVTVAANGRIAWEHAQDEQFDMVVTDQQMPEMTGCEFCRLLRGVENYRDIPVIMLTAKGMELELPKLKTGLGISATCLNPFSPKEIIQAVEDHLTAVS